ncbi:MAG: hemolysin [Paenibacillaceae bacterium]|nr:hemolysin [Paenibacillaceae bacterium]
MFVEIAVLILLILLNAFFAASEIALITLNDNKVKSMAEKGDKKSVMLLSLLSEPSRFLATIQIGITLAGFLASAFAAENFAGRLAQFLYDSGVPVQLGILNTISLILITLILSYFTLVLGELVPKRLAMQKAEGISKVVVGPLTILSKVSAPFVKMLTLSTNLLVRMMGVDPNAKDEQVTEEEIRMMVDVGKENGTILENEKEMINNIFEFNNKYVSDIMTHRRSVVGLSSDIASHDLAELIVSENYTRFPVYEGSLDQVIGILHVKDLMPYLEKGIPAGFDLLSIIRQPYFIPESKPTDQAFKELQKHNVHLAVAIDEYGGMAGIITIEDLLEEIVGSIQDEHDDEEKEFELQEDGSYRVDGLVSLRVINQHLHTGLPSDIYDTLSGFIIGSLGFIPGPDDRPTLSLSGFLYTVEEVDNMRISKVIIKMQAEAESDTED